MTGDQVVSVSVYHPGSEDATVRCWRITRDEAETLAAEFEPRFGPPVSVITPLAMLEDIEKDPRAVSTE